MAGLVPWYFNKYTRKKNKLFYNIWQHLCLVLLINLKNSVRGYSSSLAPLLRTHIVFFCTFTLYFSSSFVSSFFSFFFSISALSFFFTLWFEYRGPGRLGTDEYWHADRGPDSMNRLKNLSRNYRSQQVRTRSILKNIFLRFTFFCNFSGNLVHYRAENNCLYELTDWIAVANKTLPFYVIVENSFYIYYYVLVCWSRPWCYCIE